MHEHVLTSLGLALTCGLLLMAVQKIRVRRGKALVCPPNLLAQSMKLSRWLTVVYVASVAALTLACGIDAVMRWGFEGVLLLCNLWVMVEAWKDTRLLGLKHGKMQ